MSVDCPSVLFVSCLCVVVFLFILSMEIYQVYKQVLCIHSFGNSLDLVYGNVSGKQILCIPMSRKLLGDFAALFVNAKCEVSHSFTT